mgnify:CR=1 FL=1
MTAKKNTQIYAETELLDTLTEYANLLKISRNQLICNLLQTGCEEMEIMREIGALRVGVVIRDLMESEIVSKWRKATSEG